MGRALKCGQGWLTGVGSGWTEAKPYKVRDLPQEKGGSLGGVGVGVGVGGREAQVPLSSLWWIRPDGSSYHRARSSFSRTESSSIPVYLIPTRSSPPSTSTVVSSKPNSWTHFLQINGNGSAWPRSHLSMGPSQGWKTWTLQLAPSVGRAAHATVSTTTCLGRVKPLSARVLVGRLWWPVYCTIRRELLDGPQLNGTLTSCAWPVHPPGVKPPQT